MIDTHIHLDHNDFNGDLNAVLDRAIANDVDKFIIPGADPRGIKKAIKIAYENKNVFYAIGTHPYDIEYFNESEMRNLLKGDQKHVAIGECGLDYFRLPKDEKERLETIAKQKQIFKTHIAIANEKNLPLIAHIRDAAQDSLEILRNSKTGGALHCFTGDEILLSLADRNFYFGIGGAITFQNAKKLQETAAKIPLDRIILETDAPYLAPAPHRGKRNEAAFIPLIAAKIAEIKGVSQELIAEISTENARKLFKI
ncbi:MAG: TatD family hydrolase [Helicobacteraceae bacterium]|jgi:TatD DNase family protein|nr:TatD family hydrolase [Helicobacteraceae bacterium]